MSKINARTVLTADSWGDIDALLIGRTDAPLKPCLCWDMKESRLCSSAGTVIDGVNSTGKALSLSLTLLFPDRVQWDRDYPYDVALLTFIPTNLKEFRFDK